MSSRRSFHAFANSTSIRETTRRNRGVELKRMISELNSFLGGWVMYFRYAACRSHLRDLDQWLRRKLRCVRLKQCKRVKPIAAFLHRLGVPSKRAGITALSGKGWWRLSGAPSVQEALTLHWFNRLGPLNLERRYAALLH
ncbi:MAG: hypothetical protein JNG88_17330 [Phycisphaerales bacterium]|nr:hypothetical protein [Phycisphaerales bacterium]